MVELGARTSTSERWLTLGWAGVAIVMSFVVVAIDFLRLPLQTVYVFVAGVTLQEATGLTVWALRR